MTTDNMKIIMCELFMFYLAKVVPHFKNLLIC